MILSRRNVLVATGLGLPLGALSLACRSGAPAPERLVAGELGRDAIRVVTAEPTHDGAGVSLSRALGNRALSMLDPFLMLDEFQSDDPNDYLAGFPSHPHRGFETVTYMIDGAMEHQDNVGNRGRLGPGGAQWMTAGHGIIHSEMPKQERGLMWGFQLWVNLPRARKLIKPRYQDIAPTLIPEIDHDGARVRVVAGSAFGAEGPVRGIDVEPVFLDVALESKRSVRHALPPAHTAFVYVTRGAVRVGPKRLEVRQGQLAVLGPGEFFAAEGAEGGGRVLLFAGRPLNEPVARRGPFVMSTQAELRQAYEDYEAGVLTQGA